MVFMGKGGNSALADVLARLRGEPGHRPHWTSVAKTVVEIRDSGQWRARYQSPTEWLEAAADASGYKPNTLRRLIAAWKFLTEHHAEVAAWTSWAEESSKAKGFDLFAGSGTLLVGRRFAESGPEIGAIELIKRINDIAPDRADEVLKRHIADGASFREIKRTYDDLVAGKYSIMVGSPPYKTLTASTPNIDASKLGLRRSYSDKKDLVSIIQNEIEGFSGTKMAQVFADRYGFDFVSPDAISIGRDGFTVSFVDGFEMKKLGSHLAPSVFKKLIAEVAFSSTFFRRYWVLVDGNKDQAKSIIEALDTLAVASVGVALLKRNSANPVKILRRPSRAPTPDRHDLSRAAVLHQGVPAA